jgi:hypothetical protein
MVWRIPLMAYNFGNIFVQAMENQKRLATQRQQFDQEMQFRREQEAEGMRRFDISRDQTNRQIGLQERGVGLQERGVRLAEDTYRENQIPVGSLGNLPYGNQIQAALPDREKVSSNIYTALGGMFSEQDRINALQNQYQRIVTNTQTGAQRVIGQNEQPGENESFDPAITMDIRERFERTNTVANIATELGAAAQSITPTNIDQELGRFEGVLKRINSAGIDRLTREDVARLQLEPAMYNLSILSQRLDPDSGDKNFIKQIGGKQKAVEYRRKVDSIINMAAQRGVQESTGMYHGD